MPRQNSACSRLARIFDCPIFMFSLGKILTGNDMTMLLPYLNTSLSVHDNQHNKVFTRLQTLHKCAHCKV